MKSLLTVLFCLCVLVGCGKKPLTVDSTVEIADPIVEKEIRRVLQKPTGELTKADLEKVTGLFLAKSQLTEIPTDLKKLTQLDSLSLWDNKLTSLEGLEKLAQLKELDLQYNPELTKAQIDQLQKALPKCEIKHNAKK